MALPDYLKYEAGTSKSWKNTGGDYAIDVTSLANNAARQGAKGDLGANRARRWAVLFSSAVAVAATAGKTIDLYWAPSPNATAGTDNPGNTTGADAALANPDELTPQLIFVGSLVLSNARGTNVQTALLGPFEPPTRYGMPVVYNVAGQALTGTGANHEVRMIPIEEGLEDTV